MDTVRAKLREISKKRPNLSHIEFEAFPKFFSTKQKYKELHLNPKDRNINLLFLHAIDRQNLSIIHHYAKEYPEITERIDESDMRAEDYAILMGKFNSWTVLKSHRVGKNTPEF